MILSLQIKHGLSEEGSQTATVSTVQLYEPRAGTIYYVFHHWFPMTQHHAWHRAYLKLVRWLNECLLNAG